MLCPAVEVLHPNSLEVFMAIERTLSIVKPDTVAKNVIGKIYDRFESNGLKIVAAKMKHLSKKKLQLMKK